MQRCGTGCQQHHCASVCDEELCLRLNVVRNVVQHQGRSTMLRRAVRERTIKKWLKWAEGAFELTGRNKATIYASSVDVLVTAAASPIFLEQLDLARTLKAAQER